MTKTTKILIILLLAAIGSGVYFFLRNRNTQQKLADQTSMVSALSDTVRITKNAKDSSESAIIASFGITKSSLIQQIKNTEDEGIRRVQELEKKHRSELKNGGAILSTANNTKVNTTVPTEVVKDTTTGEDIYLGKINLAPWITGNSIARKDSTIYNINVYNEVDAIIGQNKGEWTAEIILKNPYSTTTRLRALNVTGPKKKNWAVTASIGAGGTYVNDKIKAVPFIGIAVGRKLFEF